MVRYILSRPVGVLLAFIAVIILGCITFFHVPISLLPDVNVPEIIVRIDYSNTPAAAMEQNILKPIRQNLATLDHLKDIESRAANHTGIVRLRFDYGTRMNLAYIAVNEKLDRLTNTLPRDMPRPQVIRVSTADIPVIRIQVIPRQQQDYQQMSDLTDKILVKRLERLEGVSLVEVNGTRKGIIAISPNRKMLMALNMDEMWLAHAIQSANQQLGSLSVKDGQYRYFIRLGAHLREVSDIAQLPIRTPGGAIVPLSRLATVQYQPETPTGYHWYNGKTGLVITVKKQPQARMNELVPRIRNAVKQFRKDYPQVQFAITRDQSSLLYAGINNLEQDLLIGGILAIAVLFLFLGNYASPTLMSISIPISLIITFIFFYLFDISFNIISLSGLALGIGMLIDNSIVVLDRITMKRRSGMSVSDSCIIGTREVTIPVINQVLTTVAVYVPLVYLNGMAGALVFDQSIALTISLGVSLLVAFILAPLLYKMLMGDKPKKLREDTRFYKWVRNGYHRMIHYIFRYKKTFFIITILLMPVGFLLMPLMPVAALPEMEKTESLVTLNWNAPIDAYENLQSVKVLDSLLKPHTIVREAEVGIRQFLFQSGNANTIQQVSFYYSCKDEKTKEKADRLLENYLEQNFPKATWKILDAPNAFTKLFAGDEPYFEARFKSISNTYSDTLYAQLPEMIKNITDSDWKPGAGLVRSPYMNVTLNEEKMALYGVNRNTVQDILQQLFGTFTITELKNFGEVKSVRFSQRGNDPNTFALLQTPISGNDGVRYPLSNFVQLKVGEGYKFITADKTGSYKSIILPENENIHYQELQQQIRKTAAAKGMRVSFTGQYFEDRAQLKQLTFIFLLVVALMYFLLALEFENLIQPLIVMLTIPLGISGSMAILYLTGGSLNVMAAIGFIVILGLIVDDPILKVETINQLRKKYGKKGKMTKDPEKLEAILHESGDICLKPLLMVSLTTSLALVPILFISGIGNDLQKPLAWVIIGGLTIGTFFTTWFIPLAYWFFTRKNKKS